MDQPIRFGNIHPPVPAVITRESVATHTRFMKCFSSHDHVHSIHRCLEKMYRSGSAVKCAFFSQERDDEGIVFIVYEIKCNIIQV